MTTKKKTPRRTVRAGTERCSYHPKAKQFMTDAEALGLREGEWPIGITLVSRKTGAEKLFLRRSTHYYPSGQVQCVSYWNADTRTELVVTH